MIYNLIISTIFVAFLLMPIIVKIGFVLIQKKKDPEWYKQKCQGKSIFQILMI